ncbi:radial spoke head 1 homolog [Metopolophium dirhodum]|uniref:radial spoke head 1 homolog n=1 Tax=Metopolophium dirhodum TaxID=44670 RepID=UPI00298FC114|nr:radial spoke head 1 homolog [Metopolophium dirhodum]
MNRGNYSDVEDEDNFGEYVPEDEYGGENDFAHDALSVIGAYKGQRNSEDERHGFGKAILPNGDAYVGTYKNGKRHGRGQYRFVNGAIYQGCYREGLRNGKGVMVYNDKSKYEGYWIDNKKDGEGIFKFKNSDKFSGTWKSDMKHGSGTYTFCKTGAVLKGIWQNDKRVKNFQVFYPIGEGTGFTYHGTWDDNELVAGKGYFVFEHLKCMQSGVYVENPFYENAESIQLLNKICKSVWLSNEILPIISGMLPRLPKTRSVAKARSSCDTSFLLADKMSAVDVTASTMSGMEMYEHRDDLWAEMEDIETESRLNMQGVDAKLSDSNDHNE